MSFQHHLKGVGSLGLTPSELHILEKYHLAKKACL